MSQDSFSVACQQLYCELYSCTARLLFIRKSLIVQCKIVETQKFLKNNNIYLRLRGKNSLEVEENWKIRNSCKIRKSGISDFGSLAKKPCGLHVGSCPPPEHLI